MKTRGVVLQGNPPGRISLENENAFPPLALVFITDEESPNPSNLSDEDLAATPEVQEYKQRLKGA